MIGSEPDKRKRAYPRIVNPVRLLAKAVATLWSHQNSSRRWRLDRRFRAFLTLSEPTRPISARQGSWPRFFKNGCLDRELRKPVSSKGEQKAIAKFWKRRGRLADRSKRIGNSLT